MDGLADCTFPDGALAKKTSGGWRHCSYIAAEGGGPSPPLLSSSKRSASGDFAGNQHADVFRIGKSVGPAPARSAWQDQVPRGHGRLFSIGSGSSFRYRPSSTTAHLPFVAKIDYVFEQDKCGHPS